MHKTTARTQLSDCVNENDHTYFEWLYKTYWKTLLDQSYYYLKDRSLSEEIVQQLFIDIFRRHISLEQIGNPGAYLRTAVRNRAYNCLLKNKRYRRHLQKFGTKTTAVSDNSIADTMDMIDMQQQISFHLSQLEENCRLVFLLNRDKQLTIKEIAVKLKRPQDTVTKQLRKAVKYLYKCIYPPTTKINRII